MYRPLLLLATLCSLALAACSPADPFIPKGCNEVAYHQGAFLRVIVAAPQAPPFRTLVDSTSMFVTPRGYLRFGALNNNVGPAIDNDTEYYMVPPVSGGSRSKRMTAPRPTPRCCWPHAATTPHISSACLLPYSRHAGRP